MRTLSRQTRRRLAGGVIILFASNVAPGCTGSQSACAAPCPEDATVTATATHAEPPPRANEDRGWTVKLTGRWGGLRPVELHYEFTPAPISEPSRDLFTQSFSPYRNTFHFSGKVITAHFSVQAMDETRRDESYFISCEVVVIDNNGRIVDKVVTPEGWEPRDHVVCIYPKS